MNAPQPGSALFLTDITLEETMAGDDELWFTDASIYYEKDTPYTGYAAMNIINCQDCSSGSSLGEHFIWKTHGCFIRVGLGSPGCNKLAIHLEGEEYENSIW